MIQCVINNRNRLTFLKQIIGWLEKTNQAEIIIIDNDSTFKDLLDYYETIKNDIQIIRLKNNLGHNSIYKIDLINKLNQFFVYTDPDILPCENCPLDVMEYLLESKKKYKNYNKIGLSLKIDDIPNNYKFKKEVIKWEKKYWNREFEEFYIADVDTTFAMYDKNKINLLKPDITNCLRTKMPYIARHLPWYLDLNNLDEEENYYIKNSNAKFINKNNKITNVGMWTNLHKNNKLKML